jgi:hypothetical protein
MAIKGNDSVREVFARVSQILMVVNMEDEERDTIEHEDSNEDGILWVLTDEERTKARILLRA